MFFLWVTFHMSPLYKHAAPLGLNMDGPSSVFSVQSVIQTNETCRPAINMSPLWGFGLLLIPACYKHVAALGLDADHYIKKPLINQPHRDNITDIRNFHYSPRRGCVGFRCRSTQPTVYLVFPRGSRGKMPLLQMMLRRCGFALNILFIRADSWMAFSYHVSRFTLTHAAPLGLWFVGHVARL